jgi:hypothetical protein
MIIKKTALITVIYLYIFMPPVVFLPFSILNILGIVAYSYITYYKLWSHLISFLKGELIVLTVGLVYLVIRVQYSFESDYSFIKEWFKLLFLTFPVGFSIILYMFKPKNNIINHHNYIITPVILAGLISIFLILFPSANFFLKTSVMRFSEIFSSLNAFKLRGFGFSDSLLFGYPIALALMIGFVSENIKTLLMKNTYIIVLVIPMIFNARIGLMVAIFFWLHSLLISRQYKKIMGIIPVLLSIAFMPTLFGLIEKYNFRAQWLFDGAMEVYNFVRYGYIGDGNIYTLSNMITLPKNLLFGMGENIFYTHYRRSDIGFIQQLYYGGYVFISIIALFIITMAKRGFKTMGLYNWFPNLALFTIVLANTKGNFISANPGFHGLILIYFYYLKKNITTSSSRYRI